MSALDTAPSYAALGWATVPLCGVKHQCPSPGKVPVDLSTGNHLPGWQSRGIPTYAELETWLNSPLAARANVGALTGRISGIVALDIDGEGGEFLLNKHAQGDLPETWEYITGGGRRLIYAFEEGLRSIKIAGDGEHEGLEVLADGRQMVLPPSVHHSGRSYTWVPGRDPWSGNTELAPCPAWIRSLAGANAAPKDWAGLARKSVSHGGRHPTLVQLAAHMAAKGEAPEFIVAMLEAWNEARCQPPKDSQEIRRIVRWALEQHPPAPATDAPAAQDQATLDRRARTKARELGCSLAAARQLIGGMGA